MNPPKYTRFLWGILLAAMAAAVWASSSRPPAPKDEVTVSAAVSLKDALDEISALYHQAKPATSVHLNLGGSGTLQRQIEQGAPVDVFISASVDEMNALASKRLLLEETRRELVTNQVVLIVPSGKSEVASFQDLAKPGVKQIAIGEPQTVPAGKYAREVLTHFGLYDRLKTKLIFGKDVRQVLAYVETDNVDAGIAYATDAKASTKVQVVATAPKDSHSPVIYPVAVIKSAPNPEGAKEFVAFLLHSQARAVFSKYGFLPASQ